MKRGLRWLFYLVMLAYIAYNVMWVIGITFSYSKNDSPKELLYILLTFVIDIPIIWYLSKNLKLGLLFIALALLLSVGDGIAQQWLEGVIVPVMWYAPKLVPITVAIALYRS